MAVKAISFTRNRIRALPTPKTGRADYKDTSTKGLQLRITSNGHKSFSYRGTLNGRDKRITIGEFGVVSVQDAQNEAARLRSLMKDGVDPSKAKRSLKHANITLSECLEDYLALHSNLAPRTIKQYRSEITTHLKSWLKKPIKNLGRTEIATKHRAMSKSSPALANRVMRVLRALFNFANQEYEDEEGRGLFPDNPVSRLSHQRLWNKIERRSGVLKPHQIKPWMEATERLPEMTRFGDILRDYLQLVLFTGLRKTEALTLKWENIDFKGRTLLVPHTKNKKPHTLPMSDFLFDLLMRRQSCRVNDYVFSACYGEGNLTTPTKAIYRVRELTGLDFTLHDLRRTFITIAESLDLSPYAVKRLVNHSMGNDVTAGYIVWDVERIREPMQNITDYITKAAGLKPTAKIVKLSKKKQN